MSTLLKTLGALVFLLCPLGLRAQASFLIPVTNTSGVAIPGATVTLTCVSGGCGSSIYTGTTDSAGNMKFSNVTVGRYTVSIVGVGITPYSYTYDVSSPNPSSLNNIVFVDGVTYPFTQAGLVAAITALPADGGNIYIACGAPQNVFQISSTVVNTKPNVYIHGCGADTFTDAGTGPTPNTFFRWTGGSSGPIFQNTAIAGSGNNNLHRGGLDNIYFDCQNTGTIGLQLQSANYGNYHDLTFINCTSEAIDLVPISSSPGLGEFRDVQFNNFQNIIIRESEAASGHGLKLEGDSSANSSENTFLNLRIRYKNGNGIEDLNGDNNVFVKTVASQAAGGSGIGIHLSGTGSSYNTSAREESFYGVDAGAGGITEDSYAGGNSVLGYTTCNGGTYPVESGGHTSPLTFQLQYCQGNASSNLFRIQQLNLPGGVLFTSTAPTISSGFGTSPSIVQQNGTAAFEVNVGTGGSATSGVIGLPTAANGWSCTAIDMSTNIVTRETAFTTTSVTFTAASAWTASDKLLVNCGAF